MCVIMMAAGVRPTEDMVRRAWDSNSHGFGIAWRKGKKGDAVVAWKKGVMDVEDAVKLCATIPMPYVAHFRVASIGGVKPELTHPFHVSANAELDLEGTTKGSVLFHNGHWQPWNDRVLESAIHSNTRLPEGFWSDSRGMAFMVSIYGPSLMDMLSNQKGVVMEPERFHIFTGPGWEQVQGVWCSNDYFWLGRKTHQNTAYTRLCEVGRCRETAQQGKSICRKCEDERIAKAKQIATAAETVAVPQVPVETTIAIVTGGSERTGPLARMFSMQEVENFHKAGLLSKSFSKKYRKWHDMKDQKGNRGVRALTQLTEMSEEAAQRLMDAAGTKN